MRIILIFTLCLLSSHSLACEDVRVEIGGWSKHFISSGKASRKEPWNEEHNVLRFQCNRWGVMKFYNSWDKEAYAASYSLPVDIWSGEHIRTEVYTALWTGYDELTPTTEGVLPVAALKMGWVMSQHRVVNFYLTPVVVAVTLEIHF